MYPLTVGCIIYVKLEISGVRHSSCMAHIRTALEAGEKKKVIERNNVIPLLNVPFILAITCSHCRHTDLSWTSGLQCYAARRLDLRQVKGPKLCNFYASLLPVIEL